MMNVKAQPGHECRLSDSLCIKDKSTEVESTATVRRRLRDGSLIRCNTNTPKKQEKKMPKNRGNY